MSSRPEPLTKSRDTGQWIPCLDRCQPIITWMSNIKLFDVTQGYLPWSNYKPEYGHQVAKHHCCYYWVHTPMIHTARHVDHEKRVASIVFYFYTCMWLYLCSTVINGAPLDSASAATPTVLYWFIKAQLGLTTYRPIKVGDDNKLILQ